MQLELVAIIKPDDVNLVLGQSHFIKTVEDLHEALVGAVPGIRFGLAFCEASGVCLVRSSGTDEALVSLAEKNALAIAAGHSFISMCPRISPTARCGTRPWCSSATPPCPTVPRP